MSMLRGVRVIKCTFRKMTELGQGPTLGDTWGLIVGDAILKNNDCKGSVS